MKKILSVLLLASLVLSLASCHGRLKANSTDGSDYSRALTEYELPKTLDESKTYEISFLAKSDSNETQTEIYRRAITEFEALYPNIKVKLSVDNDYSRIYQTVITNIPTDTTPNVCITYPDHVATYLTGDAVVIPLDSLFTDEKYGLGGSEVRFDSPSFDELTVKYLDECKINGGYYALPFMRSTEACYINRDLVESLGYTIPETLTWDFIFEVSEAALAKNEDGTYLVNGQSVLIPFIYKSTDNMMIQMLEQLEAPYSNSDGDVLLFNDTARDILCELYGYADSGAMSTFKIVSYPGNYFNRGQCIFAIDSTAGATWIGSGAPQSDISKEEFVDFETVVMPIPQYDAEDVKMISQGPSLCLFNKADKGEVLASWLFMQYLLTDGVQIPYSTTEGYVPVTEKAKQNAEYLDYLSRSGEDNDLYYKVKLDAVKMLIENTDNTFVTPVFNGSANLRNAAGQLIEEVCRASLAGKTVDGRYVDSLFREMRTLYRLEREVGEIPAGAIVLIVGVFSIDALIAAYFVVKSVKKSKKYSKKS